MKEDLVTVNYVEVDGKELIVAYEMNYKGEHYMLAVEDTDNSNPSESMRVAVMKTEEVDGKLIASTVESSCLPEILDAFKDVIENEE